MQQGPGAPKNGSARALFLQAGIREDAVAVDGQFIDRDASLEAAVDDDGAVGRGEDTVNGRVAVQRETGGPPHRGAWAGARGPSDYWANLTGRC